MKGKNKKDTKVKDTRKDNLVNVAKEIVDKFDGEVMAKSDKVDKFEGVVYDTDILNTPLTITSLKFAKEGLVKGKKVYYFILTAVKKSGEIVKILTNHAYVEMVANHLKTQGTGLQCQIKYNKEREFYYLDSPEG